MRFNARMESSKLSRRWGWRERLWLLAFLIIQATMLWQSFSPWLLQQVPHGG
jgi:hypothetical protein